MKFILTACLFFILLIFNNCNVCSCKKVPCPGFNNSLFTSWFPYTINQQIFFKNGSSTDTVTILNVVNSDPYDASQGCYNGALGCNTSSQIYSGERTGDRPKLQIYYGSQTPFESTTTSENINLTLRQFNCTAKTITDQGLQVVVSPLFSVQFFSSVVIAGNTYNNVQLIRRDTNDYTGPYKVYLEKNTGIVAFENYPDLQTWVKQ